MDRQSGQITHTTALLKRNKRLDLNARASPLLDSLVERAQGNSQAGLAACEARKRPPQIGASGPGAVLFFGIPVRDRRLPLLHDNYRPVRRQELVASGGAMEQVMGDRYRWQGIHTTSQGQAQHGKAGHDKARLSSLLHVGRTSQSKGQERRGSFAGHVSCWRFTARAKQWATRQRYNYGRESGASLAPGIPTTAATYSCAAFEYHTDTQRGKHACSDGQT